MIFKQFRSVPTSATRENPDWQKLQVKRGDIIQWLIFSDPEAANLLHYKVVYHGVQLIPYSGDQWLEGFLEPIVLIESIKLDEPPYILDVYAYNEDDTFEHEYYIQVNINPPSPVTPGVETAGMWEKIKGFIGVD